MNLSIKIAKIGGGPPQDANLLCYIWAPGYIKARRYIFFKVGGLNCRFGITKCVGKNRNNHNLGKNLLRLIAKILIFDVILPNIT